MILEVIVQAAFSILAYFAKDWNNFRIDLAP